MLKIFNDLEPFFSDNYRRINVREYARIRKISAPSASSLLLKMSKAGLLKREEEKNFIYYFPNKYNRFFIDLMRMYWWQQLGKSGLFDFLEIELINPLVVLFGSFSKAEVKPDSDMDLAIFTDPGKNILLGKFEKKIGRKFQIFIFKDRTDVKNRALLNNILNGYIVLGGW